MRKRVHNGMVLLSVYLLWRKTVGVNKVVKRTENNPVMLLNLLDAAETRQVRSVSSS